MRPYQWSKNILLFAGLIFSLSGLDRSLVFINALGFLLFSLMCSSVYLLNDIKDKEKDKLHPVKRFRPIAADRLSVPIAIAVLTGLFLLSALLSFRLDFRFGVILVAYFFINVAYTFVLKTKVILDVLVVSLGFLIRSMAGAVLIHVDISPWLFVCTLMLALFLSFGKRRSELNLLESAAGEHRLTLGKYSGIFLDHMLTISATCSILTYSLYTMADSTVERFDTKWLVLTTPFVIYGILRYFFWFKSMEKVMTLEDF